MSDDQQHYPFQAEVARLLDLMVHSVYSEREVFLRELVSNAADALDKLRYEALTHEGRTSEGETLAIRLAADAAARTLTIRDNGIGMSKEELIDNLGTIARSGTRAFMETIKSAEADKKPGAPDLIGQFGVGFYSAFMVADRVEVVSRRAGSDEAWRWTSDGKGTFDIDAAPAETPRGTAIVLHLKEDAGEFLEEGELRRIVHTYSDHISFPIYLAAASGDQEGAAEDGAADTQLNAANALWTRPKAEISEEQYKEFYRHVGGMYDDPALTVHYTAEGRQAYTSLLFVPSLAPFDLYDPQRAGHIRLYVKRVFITDDAKLLPSYLRFVRGVVDSEDIPLNISREMLQNNPLMAAMRKAITGKVLSELARLADNDAEKFLGVWQNFGAVLKEGLYEDPERRDALYKLARFETTTSDKPAAAPAGDGADESAPKGEAGRWRSLADYVGAMKDGQKAIYYLTGDSREQILASPQLEGYLARGLEVLLLADPVDAFWVTTAAGYDGKPFRSITQGSADLADLPLTDEAAKDKGEDIAADALIDKLKSVLGEDVSDVQTSARLIGSPACLIAPAYAPDRQMEKLMQRQQGGKGGLAPILEINAGHALARALADCLANGNDGRFADLAFLLLDEARILEGRPPADPARFAERLNRLVTGAA